jgi:hypothetical protein
LNERHDLKFAAEHVWMGIQVDFVRKHWSTQGPLYYLMAQLTWNPHQDGQAILDDYYRRAFAPAAAELEEYWTYLEQLRESCYALSESGGVGMSVVKPPKEAKWELVFHDDFERDKLEDRWRVAAGKWRIEDGALRRGGALVSSRRFPGNDQVGFLRMEFKAVTDVQPSGSLGKEGTTAVLPFLAVTCTLLPPPHTQPFSPAKPGEKGARVRVGQSSPRHVKASTDASPGGRGGGGVGWLPGRW